MDACLLFSVTIVGFETIFDFCTCCSALRTKLKSLAENTADNDRFVASLLVRERRLLSTLLTVVVPVSVIPLMMEELLSDARVPVVPVVEVTVGVPLLDVMVELELDPLVCPLLRVLVFV